MDHTGYRQWLAREPKAVFLLVHGLGTHAGRWEAAAEIFLKGGISSYAVELSDSFQNYRDNITRLHDIAARENPGKKIFLVGESLGALASFLLCASRPALFDGLICISPAFAPKDKISLPDGLKIFARLILNPNSPFKLPFDSSMVTRDPYYVNKLEADPREYRTIPIRFVFWILLTQARAMAARKKIIAPALFLIAGEDKLVDTDISIKIFRDIGAIDKELIDFPGMYHSLSVDLGRDAVMEEILRWTEKRI